MKVATLVHARQLVETVSYLFADIEKI